MDKKYDQFLNYNWNTSEEWRKYFYNLYPLPDTPEKAMHFRKRFYKLNVDPDFDDKYKPEMEKTQEKEHHHSASCSHDTSSSQRKGVIESIVASIEGFIWVVYFFNMVLKAYIFHLCIFAFFLRYLRLNGFPKKIDKEFMSSLIKDEYVQLIIYCIVLLIEPNALLIFFPLTITGLFCISDYFTNFLRIFETLKQYFKKISDRKDSLVILRSYTFIAVNSFLLLGAVIKINGITLALVYFCYIKFLGHFNIHMQYALTMITKKIRETRFLPNFSKSLWIKVIKSLLPSDFQL
jgi:hypothetical protein